MSKINVKSLYAVPLTSDVEGSVVYDIANKFLVGDAIDISLSDDYATGEQWAGGRLKNKATQLNKIEFEMETDDITLSAKAKLKGKTVANGGYTTDDKVVEKYFALMFEGELTGDHKQYVCLYKAIAEFGTETFKTRDGNINFGTEKVKFTCLSNADGKFKHTARTDEESYTDTVGAKWYDAPYGYTGS